MIAWHGAARLLLGKIVGELADAVGCLRQHEGPGEKCGAQSRVRSALLSYSKMHNFSHFNVLGLEADELYI